MGKRQAIEDYCCICGNYSKMTDEHIPPQSAYNNSTVVPFFIGDVLGQTRSGKRLHFLKRQIRQGGIKYPSLCGDCNNKTGSWYGSEYARWATTAHEVVQYMKDADLSEATIRFEDVYPMQFLKQAVCCFLSINGYQSQGKYLENNPDLAKFVLDRDSMAIPEQYRFFITLFPKKPNTVMRQMPIAAKLKVRHSDLQVLNATIFSEIAHPPLAITMTDDGSLVHDATEFTQFAKYAYNEQVTVNIPMRIVDSSSPFPASYG